MVVNQRDPMSTTPHPVLLYDDVCALCNRLIPFVLERDRGALFRVATLQSAFGQQALRRHGQEPSHPDTMAVLLDQGLPSEQLLLKARAALYVLQRLPGPWRHIAAALRWLPAWLLDLAYDLVARNHYRLFGRTQACALPRPEWRDRFEEA